jgi:hypothetical protein
VSHCDSLHEPPESIGRSLSILIARVASASWERWAVISAESPAVRAACGREASPLDRALAVHISHLRRKLGRHAPQIVTVRGVGYMLSESARDRPERAR